MSLVTPLIYVFDSSAMLAYLKGEPEGARVAQTLKTAGALFLAHSVNLCEVVYNFGPPSIEQNRLDAEAALQWLQQICLIQERADLDTPFWQDAARLIAERRAMPRDPARPKAVPSLAFGVCLANRVGGQFVTKDRSEIEPLHQAGMVNALFIC